MKCACLGLPLPLHGSIQLISIACPPTNHECCWQPLERTGPPCVRKWVSLAGLRDLMLLKALCDAECKESQALHGTRMVLSCHLHKLFTMQVKATKLLFNRTSNDYDSILSYTFWSAFIQNSTGSFKIISSNGFSSRMERPLDFLNNGFFAHSVLCDQLGEHIVHDLPGIPLELLCGQWTSSNLGMAATTQNVCGSVVWSVFVWNNHLPPS